MNKAQKLQDKWNVTTADFSRRLGISAKTAAKWIAGGNTKDVGETLLQIAASDPDFDAEIMPLDARHRYTASEWVRHLMERFGDFRVSQFARRLGLNYATVSKWYHTTENRLKGSAEALLLYAYHNPDKFPTK